MPSSRKTGADKYFERRSREPGYVDAYKEARRRNDTVDCLMKDFDQRRKSLGLSKADLARQADLAPEMVRRLFSTTNPNPTIGTLTMLADALGLELVARRRQASQSSSSTKRR